MYGAWSWGFKTKGKTKEDLERGCTEDCQVRKLNKEDATDRCKWRKVIKEARWSGWVWVGECFFWYWPTRVVPDQRPLNGRCCCCNNVILIYNLITKIIKLLIRIKLLIVQMIWILIYLCSYSFRVTCCLCLSFLKPCDLWSNAVLLCKLMESDWFAALYICRAWPAKWQ